MLLCKNSGILNKVAKSSWSSITNVPTVFYVINKHGCRTCIPHNKEQQRRKKKLQLSKKTLKNMAIK